LRGRHGLLPGEQVARVRDHG